MQQSYQRKTNRPLAAKVPSSSPGPGAAPEWRDRSKTGLWLVLAVDLLFAISKAVASARRQHSHPPSSRIELALHDMAKPLPPLSIGVKPPRA